jgi:hypothetical protein
VRARHSVTQPSTFNPQPAKRWSLGHINNNPRDQDMIHPIHLLARVAALFATASLLPAQSLNNPNGTAYTPVFSTGAGHAIGGIDLDAAGNIYYLDTDTNDADGNSSTQLIQRALNGNTTTLFTFAPGQSTSSNVFGSFVRVSGTTIYWGESYPGTIWSATITGNSIQNAVNLGTIASNYDLAVSPGGEVYLSAGPDFGQNHVYRLTLGAGTITPTSNVVSKVFDNNYSGPIAFDTAGNLIYGAPLFDKGGGGIFRFGVSELAGTTELTLAGHALINNGANGYLQVGPNGLIFQDYGGTLRQYDTSRGNAETPLAVSDGFLGNIAYRDGQIYTVVSSFGATGQSVVYAVAPEPGSVTFLALGLAACFQRRFRRG